MRLPQLTFAVIACLCVAGGMAMRYVNEETSQCMAYSPYNVTTDSYCYPFMMNPNTASFGRCGRTKKQELCANAGQSITVQVPTLETTHECQDFNDIVTDVDVCDYFNTLGWGATGRTDDTRLRVGATATNDDITHTIKRITSTRQGFRKIKRQSCGTNARITYRPQQLEGGNCITIRQYECSDPTMVFPICLTPDGTLIPGGVPDPFTSQCCGCPCFTEKITEKVINCRIQKKRDCGDSPNVVNKIIQEIQICWDIPEGHFCEGVALDRVASMMKKSNPDGRLRTKIKNVKSLGNGLKSIRGQICSTKHVVEQFVVPRLRTGGCQLVDEAICEEKEIKIPYTICPGL